MTDMTDDTVDIPVIRNGPGKRQKLPVDQSLQQSHLSHLQFQPRKFAIGDKVTFIGIASNPDYVPLVAKLAGIAGVVTGVSRRQMGSKMVNFIRVEYEGYKIAFGQYWVGEKNFEHHYPTGIQREEVK